MTEEQNSNNHNMQENNQNMEEKDLKDNQDIQKKDIEVNEQKKDEKEGEELKLGQYILTPLQSILINKKIPFGFKLETEENIIKSIESTKISTKRAAKVTKHKNHLDSQLISEPPASQKRKNKTLDVMPSNMNPENFKIYKKCKKGIDRIKMLKYANKFYQSNNPDIPCLSVIEKKINNNEYKSIYDFAMDGRNLWSYYFNINQEDEITKKMSEEWEKMITDLDNADNEISPTPSSIRKKAEHIQKELVEMNDHGGVVRDTAPNKKVSHNNDSSKPMTPEEKNLLGINIRALNKDQLRGIIQILSDKNSVPKEKYFEFDIDKLPTKKLRELEIYVKGCLSANNKNKNNNTNNNKINHNTQNQNKNNNTHNDNSNIKTNNTQNNNQNQNNKAQEQENPSAKKLKSSVKKTEKKNNSFSESDSMSSDSSLSN